MLDVDLVNILELIPGDSALLFRAGYGWQSDTLNTAQIAISSRSQANYTLAAFGPVLVSDLRAETRFTPSPMLLDHSVVSGMSTTIIGHNRRKYGIFSVHTRHRRVFNDYDVALLSSIANIIAGAIQRRQLDERQGMMIRELHHRSGNLFSQLLALLSQTALTSKNIPDLVSKYEARVLALANANRLMVEGGWQPASLLELLRTQLAPYLDQVSLTGPDVYVDPALALTLSSVAHELASNASKYGSLSVLAGRVDLRWTIDRTEPTTILVLDWHESGGPKPKRPVRPGFGLRLINTVIKRQMNGEVRRTFSASGLRCRLSIRLTHERWPETAPLPA
jgi:two-component sensor histidine kinase